MKLIECALISADEGFRHSVLGVLRQNATQVRLALDLQVFADGLNREAVGKILQARPAIVFLDLGPDPEGVGGIRILSQEAPDIDLIVAGPSLTAEGLLAVMRAGATEYLPRPLSQEETLEAFQRVRRRSRTAAAQAQGVPGRVTTVFSAKGGTGVTTVATNLAVALRVLTEKEVLLLDLAPSLGTASVAMGLHPRYTYYDVIQNYHRIDEELFRSFLEKHESGAFLLASPIMPTGLGSPSGEDIQTLLSLCRQYFDYVVIDAGGSLPDHLPMLLHESEDRLLVVTPELPTLRNLKQALDLFGHTNGKGPPRVILNQYREGVGLTSRDVEDGLGHRITTILENDDERVLRSINVGRPEVLGGKSRLAKSLMALAREVAGKEEVVASRKGLLGRFLRSSKQSSTPGEETK